MAKNANSLDLHGTLSFVPVDPPKPHGKYVVQRCAAGLGNVTGDKRLSTQLRAHVLPVNPRTAPQMRQRGKLAAAVIAWRALSTAEIDELRPRAVARSLPVYQFFIGEFCHTAVAQDFTAWRTEWDGHKTEWDSGKTLWRTAFDNGNTIWQ